MKILPGWCTSWYCRKDLLLYSFSLNKHINADCMISLLIFCALLALGEPVNCLWLRSSWIWVWNIHIPKWCVQLWSDHVRTFDRPSVPRQVRMDEVIIRVFQSYVNFFIQLFFGTSLTGHVNGGSNFWPDGPFPNSMILMPYRTWSILLWMEITQQNHCQILQISSLDAFRWSFV